MKVSDAALRVQLVLAVYDRAAGARWGPLRSYINSIGYEYFFRQFHVAPPLPHMGGVREGRCRDGMGVLDLANANRDSWILSDA